MLEDRSQKTTEAILPFIVAFPIYLQKGIRQHKVLLPLHHLHFGHSSQYNSLDM